MADIPWTAPDLGSLLGFVAIVLGLCVGLVAAVKGLGHGRMAAWVGLGLGLWLGFTAWVPYSGWFSLGPPALIGFMVLCNGAGLALALSPVGRVATGLPIALLIAWQGFRLPLELILHHWGQAGVIPMSMTWEGQNFDVITGILAVLSAPVAWFGGPGLQRRVGWVFGIVGFGLLLNVGRVAIQSSPGPLRSFGEPPLALAFHSPTVWIVPFCVAGALFGHVVLFRRLLGGTVA